jgi:CheY-like chemotaxis protein
MSVPSFMYTDLNEPEKPSNGKILVVDDEKFNCDIIFGFLMLLGIYNRKELTDFAFNGEQAVEAVQRAFNENDPMRYKVILMDCNMPFLDGYEATKVIRSLYKQNKIESEQQPRIIAITGHVENEYVKKAIQSGMDKVFQKPLPIKEFG